MARFAEKCADAFQMAIFSKPSQGGKLGTKGQQLKVLEELGLLRVHAAVRRAPDFTADSDQQCAASVGSMAESMDSNTEEQVSLQCWSFPESHALREAVVGNALARASNCHVAMQRQGAESSRWRCAGDSEPLNGRDLDHPALRDALQSAKGSSVDTWAEIEISADDLQGWNSDGLLMGDYIQCGGRYYQPAVPAYSEPYKALQDAARSQTFGDIVLGTEETRDKCGGTRARGDRAGASARPAGWGRGSSASPSLKQQVFTLTYTTILYPNLIVTRLFPY